MSLQLSRAAGMSYPDSPETEPTSRDVKGFGKAPCIYFVGSYRPIMCGIADYTSFITRESPPQEWGVLSFDLDKYGVPLIPDYKVKAGPYWFGIPGRDSFSAPVIRQGLNILGAEIKNSVLWFQHEFGIWPDNLKFISMLKNIDMPKVVTFHTLHFQSQETRTGLRQNQYQLLGKLLPHVDAITVFSRGVYDAVTSAYPEYSQKVYIITHGVHSYPEISRLSRKETKEKLNDFLLYESDLDQKTKRLLHKQRIFTDRNTVIVGQTGFLSPAKGSELLYPLADNLQKAIRKKRIVAIRVGNPRDKVQDSYARKLRYLAKGRNKLLLETWLPQSILPLAQRAFDINFYWPSECTQSGVLAHALGAGAIVAGRDLEGVGETLKDAGELADRDLKQLTYKIQELILNPELMEIIEGRALAYAADFSWQNQAWKHYELAENILLPIKSGQLRLQATRRELQSTYAG